MVEFWNGMPEWSVPLFAGGIAFLGALAGSVLGFLATHLSTSRQITSSARATRLDVYSSFLARANEFSATIPDLKRVIEVAKGVRSASEAEMKDIGALVATVRAEVHKASDDVDDVVNRAVSAFTALAAEQGRVALVAPHAVRIAAWEVVETASQRLGVVVHGGRGATKTFGTVLGDFTVHARSDIRSPGSIKSRRTIARRQRRLDADESWDAADGS